MNKKDIAIIGISGKFSHSENVALFWENLKQGRELIHFCTREELLDAAIDPALIADETYIKTRSVIENKGAFDAPFFGYTKDEAALMDPQIRLFHECVWAALEDAGYYAPDYKGKIGLFAGASENLNWVVYNMLEKSNRDVDAYMGGILANRSFISSLVAYKLNLRGPCYFIDTACSTSLAAVHMACRSLLMRECNIAVAGAASIKTDNRPGYKYQQGMILSRDGHCKTFDADASGTFAGEGVGVVVLKRLEEALKDNDHIYALIKSSAVNNDGSQKVGYTAPSTAGQAACIEMAHRFADITPETISYLEAHGTATALGDAVEVEALNRAFGNNKTKHCAIGAVKSNIGHLDSAAGIAGLIKTALALKHSEIPPSLHFKKPNPGIDFDSGPFYVNTKLREWERGEKGPLRAGVSSFGIGGTNAHVVLEEAPRRNTLQDNRKYHLLLVSAKTSAALRMQVAAMKAFLKNTSSPIADIAYTLQERRKHYKYRQFLLHEKGAAHPLHTEIGGDAVPVTPKVVFLFSGQGSQYLNMGKGLYESEPFFREIIDNGLNRIQFLTGEDFRPVLFNNDVNSDTQAAINNTFYAQPLLFIFEYALARLMMHMGVLPDYMIGHSIGELAAACISKVFSFEDGISLVIERAKLMSSMPPGAMLAVSKPEEEIQPYLPSHVSIAAVNTPGYCVIAGEEKDITALAAVFNKEGISCRRLKTSHAFHSGMMEPVMAPFMAAAAKINLSAPEIPFVSNISGGLIGKEAQLPGYWADHIRKTVQFSKGVAALVQKHKVLFLEIGPGNTLSTLCRQISNAYNASGNTILNLVKHPSEKTDDEQLLLERLGRLWLNGIHVNWDVRYEREKRNVVSVPPYSFEKHAFPAEINAFDLINKRMGNSSGTGKNKDVSKWFYLPRWERADTGNSAAGTLSGSNILLFAGQGEVDKQLVQLLREQANHVVVVSEGAVFEVQQEQGIVINSRDQQDYDRLYEWLMQKGFHFDQIIYMWGRGPKDTAFDEHFRNFLYLHKSFRLQEIKENRKLFFITRELQDVTGTEKGGNIGAAAALGYIKVLAQELPNFSTCCLDIDNSKNVQQLVKAIYRELAGHNQEQFLCLRNNLRWTQSFKQLAPSGPGTGILKRGGTYLLTGGLGRLGACLAAGLLSHYEARVILLGRTSLSAETDPAEWPEKQAVLRDLQQLPGSVDYYEADISDYNALQQCIEKIRQTAGKINGVIHTAGNTDINQYKPIENLGTTEVASHFNPKAAGLLNLYKVFGNNELDFMWLSSSIATVLGGLTFSAYAAANFFMDYFSTIKQRTGSSMISVDLDGLALQDDNPGTFAIGRGDMWTVFEKSLEMLHHKRVIVSIADLNERIEKQTRNSTGIAKEQDQEKEDEPVAERPALSTAYVAPGYELEAELADIWKDFFGFESIGTTDNFFELGGDSLKAMILLKKIHKIYNISISMEIFFRAPCIQAFAEEIAVQQSIELLRAKDHGNKERMEIII